MEIYLKKEDIESYLINQEENIKSMIDNLDSSWPHYNAVKKLLEETMLEIKRKDIHCNAVLSSTKHERKIEKYVNWVEVYRLANYHFSKYTSSNTSYSEGLFSTLLALNSMYIHNKKIKDIGIIGCGPGRSVLDFSLAYPDATIYGLDYSLVSLVLARNIVSTNNKNIDIIRRDDEVVIDKVNGFNRPNCKWGMFDLTKSNLNEKFDIVVCSNVINLMPNHKDAINKIYDMIKPNGYLIYADLTGWRLDRKKEQQLLSDRETIKNSFENIGFETIECFDGGPYIEKENKDNFTFYKQTYYIGRKVK